MVNKYLVVFTLLNLLALGCMAVDDESTTTTMSTTSTTTSSTSTTTSTVTSRTTTMNQNATTTPIDDECSRISNVTCQDCLKNSKCFFCVSDGMCKTYKVNGIFPQGCSASKARWFNCSLDFQALLIAIIVGAVLVVLIVGCCLCYCFNKACKSCSDRSMQRVERRIKSQRDKIKQSNEARKTDRRARDDEIRVKYGLRPSTFE